MGSGGSVCVCPLSSAQLCLPPAPHLTPEAGRGRGPGGSGEGEKEKQQGEGDPVACLLLLSTFR